MKRSVAVLAPLLLLSSFAFQSPIASVEKGSNFEKVVLKESWKTGVVGISSFDDAYTTSASTYPGGYE